MKNSIIKQIRAVFAPTFILVLLTSSTLIDKKQATFSTKEEVISLEARINDIINIKSIKNEAGQRIGCLFKEITPAKTDSLTLPETASIQIKVEKQDSYLTISSKGYKPLRINIKKIKERDHSYPIMYTLHIQLADSSSNNASKIVQKQEHHLKPENSMKLMLPSKKSSN